MRRRESAIAEVGLALHLSVPSGEQLHQRDAEGEVFFPMYAGAQNARAAATILNLHVGKHVSNTRSQAWLERFPRTGANTMSKRDAYIEKMKTQLDELNAKMSELEAKAQEAKDDARAKYREEMGKLTNQSKLAVAKLEELKAAGEDKWETMVTEMEKVRDAFKHSFNYFKSQL
jgi:hypothetical protein